MAGYRVKPPHGSVLNRAHPLAAKLASAWLFTDRSGDVARNAVDRRYDGTLSGPDRGWGYTVDGPFPKLNSATLTMSFAALTSTTTFSIACRLKQKTGGASYQTICTESSNQGFWLRSSGALTYYYGGDHLSAGTLALDTVYDIVLSCLGGVLTYYINGAADANTYSSVPTMGWTRSISDPGGDSFAGDLHYLQVWIGRALTRADAQALRADPYRHFRRRRVPVPLFSAGGGAQTGTPGVATVAVTGVAPVATGTGTATATPSAATVAVAGVGPVAAGTGTAAATPGAAVVAVTGVAPAAGAAGTVTATPGVGTVVVSGADVAVSGGGVQTATPGAATVAVTGVAPLGQGAGSVTATPGTAVVTVGGFTAAATPAGAASALAGFAAVNVIGVGPAAGGSGAGIATPGVAFVTVGALDTATTGGASPMGDVGVVIDGGVPQTIISRGVPRHG